MSDQPTPQSEAQRIANLLKNAGKNPDKDSLETKVQAEVYRELRKLESDPKALEEFNKALSRDVEKLILDGKLPKLDADFQNQLIHPAHIFNPDENYIHNPVGLPGFVAFEPGKEGQEKTEALTGTQPDDANAQIETRRVVRKEEDKKAGTTTYTYEGGISREHQYRSDIEYGDRWKSGANYNADETVDSNGKILERHISYRNNDTTVKIQGQNGVTEIKGILNADTSFDPKTNSYINEIEDKDHNVYRSVVSPDGSVKSWEQVAWQMSGKAPGISAEPLEKFKPTDAGVFNPVRPPGLGGLNPGQGVDSADSAKNIFRRTGSGERQDDGSVQYSYEGKLDDGWTRLSCTNFKASEHVDKNGNLIDSNVTYDSPVASMHFRDANGNDLPLYHVKEVSVHKDGNYYTTMVKMAAADAPDNIRMFKTDVNGKVLFDTSATDHHGSLPKETVAPTAAKPADAPVLPGATTRPGAEQAPPAAKPADAPVLPGATTRPGVEQAPPAAKPADAPVLPGATTRPGVEQAPPAAKPADAPVLPGATTRPGVEQAPPAPAKPADAPPTPGHTGDHDFKRDGFGPPQPEHPFKTMRGPNNELITQYRNGVEEVNAPGRFERLYPDGTMQMEQWGQLGRLSSTVDQNGRERQIHFDAKGHADWIHTFDGHIFRNCGPDPRTGLDVWRSLPRTGEASKAWEGSVTVDAHGSAHVRKLIYDRQHQKASIIQFQQFRNGQMAQEGTPPPCFKEDKENYDARMQAAQQQQAEHHPVQPPHSEASPAVPRGVQTPRQPDIDPGIVMPHSTINPTLPYVSAPDQGIKPPDAAQAARDALKQPGPGVSSDVVVVPPPEAVVAPHPAQPATERSLIHPPLSELAAPAQPAPSTSDEVVVVPQDQPAQPSLEQRQYAKSPEVAPDVVVVPQDQPQVVRPIDLSVGNFLPRYSGDSANPITCPIVPRGFATRMGDSHNYIGLSPGEPLRVPNPNDPSRTDPWEWRLVDSETIDPDKHTITYQYHGNFHTANGDLSPNQRYTASEVTTEDKQLVLERHITYDDSDGKHLKFPGALQYDVNGQEIRTHMTIEHVKSIDSIHNSLSDDPTINQTEGYTTTITDKSGNTFKFITDAQGNVLQFIPAPGILPRLQLDK